MKTARSPSHLTTHVAVILLMAGWFSYLAVEGLIDVFDALGATTGIAAERWPDPAVFAGAAFVASLFPLVISARAPRRWSSAILLYPGASALVWALNCSIFGASARNFWVSLAAGSVMLSLGVIQLVLARRGEPASR